MIVLDANVLSKLMRARPAPEVLAIDAAGAQAYAEIAAGVRSGADLVAWINDLRGAFWM